MAQWHVPGAVFVLVKDGRNLFSSGYGYADLEKRNPVLPDRTVFRVGSVSKIFTATAVMQLAERGKLDLNADVNHYLKLFQLEENFPEPVTMADLLTHTGGFDERSIGIAARTPEGVVPLGPYLAENMPPRVLPPGEIYSYSSFGIALAGYVVEAVAGRPFTDYIDANILEPLQMDHSSFRLDREDPQELAKGYVVRQGIPTPVPYDYFNIRPAAAMNSTAEDMAHFLIAHLEGGVFDGRRILSEQTVRTMQAQHFTADRRLAGRAYGFYEKFRNGLRLIGHGGNIRGFGSLMILIPEEHTGFFVSCNMDEPRFLDGLLEAFIDHYYPRDEGEDPQSPSLDRPEDAARVAGSYRSNPYSRTTFEKLATLYWQYSVTAGADGSVLFHHPRRFRPAEHWTEVDPFVFRRNDEGTLAISRESGPGGTAQLVTSEAVYEKIPWYGAAPFQVKFVESLLLVFLSMWIVWPIAFVARRLGWLPSPASSMDRAARLIALLTGTLAIVFVVGWVHGVHGMDLWEFVYGVPGYFRALLLIPPVATLFTVFCVFWSVRLWIRGKAPLLSRLYFSIVTLACIGFVLFLGTWRLLGLRA